VANLKNVGAVSRFIKNSKGFPMILAFLGFLGIILYRKSHGSDLWITGLRLALGPWWTRDHGVVQPLRGLGGHRDSSEIERERERRRRRRSSGFSSMAPLGGGDGHTMALNRGGRWCSNGEMVPSVTMRYWSRGGCGG
jgi:hypothetical protein